ncbi:TetR/AcrR family transcriptional regulator [Pseudonocardia yuanmonensis]|uniref:TetR/AcrR family transcriptional regulator n=1 Tax=Pseudonocardia yuanmonensis TaxID=1095914 RepID=A0ABP8WNL0_9PSEU
MTQVKRPYDASRRRAQAQARQRAVVAAAKELFERDGFRQTTIAAVAMHAGVSAETIYKGFGSKTALAKAVFDYVIAGDDEQVPVWQRPEARAVRAEPDARRKIALYVSGLALRVERSAKVQMLIRDGRHVDDSLNPVWQKLHDEGLTGMTMLGRHLLDTGQLRAGIDLDEVRDVLWNYIAVDHYERLVLDRGWSLDRYAAWLTHAITTALCQ